MRPDPGKVLVAYDGSPEARRAIHEAAALARGGRGVAVVHVIPVRSVSSRLVSLSEDDQALQRRLLAEATRLLAGEGVEAEVVEAAGDPLTEILAAVEKLGARVVAVGGHPHQFRHGLGDRLLRRARCHVLVVR
jgi:nucleotide-binding universal stress UspA family protein